MASFLDCIIKLNDKNQTRFVLDGHPIPIETEKLTKAYQLRNDIAHEVKEVKLMNSRVIAMWDNLMNVMDMSVDVFESVMRPGERASLDADYREGKERARKIATYKLVSDKVMSILEEKSDACQLNNIIPYSKTFNQNMPVQKLDWIIRRMLN